MQIDYNYKYGGMKMNDKLSKQWKISKNERLDDFWVFPKLTKVENQRSYEDSFFDFLNNEDKLEMPTNLYIHIPFCDSACIFCPYYKSHGQQNYQNKLIPYVDAIIAEMRKYSNTPYLKKRKIASVHFGGGNPFLLPISELNRIVLAIKEFFEVEVNDNWTMEGSINSIKNVEYVNGLLENGINRISFGIQTFKEDIRKSMNIKTQLDEIYRGIETLKQGGLTKYCIDMMYNLPDQSIDDFITDLENVTELEPYHIDIYNMAVFPNTYIEKLIHTEGKFKIIPSNKNQARMFLEGNRWLLEHGYKQITTNTYSRKQKEVHIGDKLYLNNCNVLGVGVSSRGYIDGYVYKNVCNIDEYIELVNEDLYPANLSYVCSQEQHKDRKMVFFPILMQIKKSEIPDYERYKGRIEYIINCGLAYWDQNTLKLTKEGIFWSGNISTLFIDEKRWKTYINSFLLAARKKINPYNEDFMGKDFVQLEDWSI